MPRSSSRQFKPAGSSHEKKRSVGATRDRKPRNQQLPTAQNSPRQTRAQLEACNKALSASEQRFRVIMDNAPVLMWVSDTQKKCTWFNKQWLAFTGRTIEQEAGNRWIENVHPDDLESCLTLRGISFAECMPFEMIYRLRRHDGEYRWLLDKGTPLHENGDQFVGYIGSCVDITERKLAEAAAQAKEAERTAELVTANEKLRAQMDERNRLENALLDISEQEQRRIGQDLHDGLCQSLSGLAFMAKSLSKTLEAQHLASLSAEAARLAVLLHQSVEESRDIAKGLHPVVMDAEGLVSALHELAARSSGSVSCRLRCERMVPMTNNVTALHLYRIAQEAVTNALKHSGARAITLSLKLRQNVLSLSVADDGCGLPEVIPASHGMGLRLMKYRADVIGADYAIGPRKNHGTRMTCFLRMEAVEAPQPVVFPPPSFQHAP